MVKKFAALSLAPKRLLETKQFSSEKKRRTMQGILDSMPEQVDAIKRERENAAIELRRFMCERENVATLKRINIARLKRRVTSQSSGNCVGESAQSF